MQHIINAMKQYRRAQETFDRLLIENNMGNIVRFDGVIRDLIYLNGFLEGITTRNGDNPDASPCITAS